MHLSLPPPVRGRRRAARAPAAAAQVVKPVFTAAHPLRVWVAGDSLAQVPGEALERIGGAVDVVGLESRLSTGLARPDLYNWFTRIEEVPHELRPKVAVLSFGADDAHNYMAGVPDGRTVGPLGTHRGAPSTGAASTASRASSTPTGSTSSGSACRSPTARASRGASRS